MACSQHRAAAAIRRPLPLVPGVVYGPLRSRRLGLSLGINLLPADHKVCSFDCIYCHCGPTDLQTTAVGPQSTAAQAFPSVQAVARAVEQALYDHPGLDSLTFSGNGEPTLHPYFAEIVFAVHSLRERFLARRGQARGPAITLFSNAAHLARPAVRSALRHVDAPILKLDAGDEETFRLVNRPAAGVSLDEICRSLHEVPHCVVQSVFVDGEVSNVTEAAQHAWLARLAEIKPVAVQIYSTDYPVPVSGPQRVPSYVLQRVAERAGDHLGVPVVPYWVD